MRIGDLPLRTAVLNIYFPSLLMTMGQGLIIPALPSIGASFGVSGALAAQVITVQLIGRAGSLIPVGIMVDRWGSRPPMIIGASLATSSGLAAALAPNFAVIIASQLTWGIGMSMWMFGREIAAFYMVRPDQRGRQMIALMGIGSTGNSIGPFLGGWLTDHAGISSLFYVYAATSAVVLLISLRHRDAHGAQPRKGGGPLRVGNVRDIHPFFRVTYVVLFLSTFGQMARSQVTNSMFPLYAQEQLGYSATTTGALFGIVGIVTFAMIVPTGLISDKMGRKWSSGGAAVFSTIGFVALPFFSQIYALGGSLLIIGIANGLAMGAMTIYTYDIVPIHARGSLQSMRRSIGEAGAMLAPVIAGALAVAFSPGAAFWAFAPLHGLSAFLLIFVARESLRAKRAAGAPTDEEIAAGAPGRGSAEATRD